MRALKLLLTLQKRIHFIRRQAILERDANRGRVTLSRRNRIVVFLVVSLGIAASAFLHSPIPQSQAYHAFADRGTRLGIPNAFDVVSNVVFLVVGGLGLWYVFRVDPGRASAAFLSKGERWPYAVFFLGVTLTAFGSAYYHFAPDNSRLVWDRLPMTTGFMAFLAAMIAERIDVKAGLHLLIPLVAVGAASVLYWLWTELRGAGDLRPYILVQLYPFVALLLLLALFPPRYTRSANLLGAVGLYGLAKLLELFDKQVFAATRVVSGHTLKHLAAGAGTYVILEMLKKRSPLEYQSR